MATDMKRVFRITELAAGLSLLLFTTGCTGYKLGSMLPDDIQTVHVPTFINETEEPNIIGETTRAVKEALQIDGSLQLTSENDADSILEVTIKDYNLTPVSYERTSRTTPNQYRINMNAAIRLVRTDNGQTIVQYPQVRGDAIFDFAADLTTAKQQALPAVSADLAHDIVELVVEYWQ